MPADTTLPEGVTLVDAFPFDSNPELITDVNGYLRGDRSVDAWTMQRVFRQFFSDGVFGTPSDALQIKKGASGLTVTIEPGMFVIQGGMGGVKESDGALTLTLDTGAAAGNVCYGVMLRYDNNPNMRGLGFRVVKGTAGADPQPPEPDQTSENVMEYRLGYVEVPNGATDLSAATVHNEKGTEVCPYAAPFEEIDISSVVADAQAGANEALTKLLAYFETYRDTIDAALSEEEATHLQQQINEIQEQLSNTDLSGSVDNESIVYTTNPPSIVEKKLMVKDMGIGTEHLKDKSVTQAKLGDDVASFIQNVVKPHPGKDIGAYSLQELIEMANDQDIELSDLDYLIGQSRNISITGYGTFAFQLIGIGHDSLASGGTSKLLTFQSIDIVCNHNMNSSNTTSGGWASSAMRTFMNGELLSKFPQYVQDVIVEVKKPYCATANGATQYSNDKLFIASEKEIFGTSSYGNDGTQYEYWSINNTNNARIKKLNGSAHYWWMRSVHDSTRFRRVNTDGSASNNYASDSYGCVPCFCIGQS